jgi:hypothetical protein
VAGTLADRSSWADFDIMAIPSDADPESAAAAMRQRADVEYAQPRYRNHAMARPNDTLYSNQWNFPAIDMERAWDIQPGASSSIIVAVLDSGMAFQTGTLRYNSSFAFRLTPFGPLYPALGQGGCAVCRGAGTRRERIDALRGRAISSGTNMPSISTGTARTSRARLASSRTTTAAQPAWPTTCA